MTIKKEILIKYKLYEYLFELCKENIGTMNELKSVELITDEANWRRRSGVDGYSIQYTYYIEAVGSSLYMHWRTVDTWNSPNQYQRIDKELKSIQRDIKLEEIGIQN